MLEPASGSRGRIFNAKYPASVAAARNRRSLLKLMATKPWLIRLASIQFREASSNPSCDAAARRSFGEFMLIEPYGNCIVPLKWSSVTHPICV
jgi:hypothetical protein